MRNALDDTVRAEAAAAPPVASAPTVAEDPHASASRASGTQSIPVGSRYRLGAELGRGGMGRVVEAYDLQLGRTVALKEVLPKGAAIAKRFAREVQLTARLEHPSIVPLYDAGTTADGRPFYVMRRVSGQPLDQLLLKAPGTTGLGERLTHLPALLAAIDAVGHAHRRGVIHRDLKPANILVGELGETVVIDWGLAKVIGEDDDHPGELIAPSDSLRTQIGAVFGTPGFMAPEQARGEPLDPRGDVYALGATLYQLLAGAPPHAGSSASEMIAKTGSHQVPPVDSIAPGAPPELVAICSKALAFAPDDRYPDAGAFAEDVRRFLAGQLVAAHHYTPGQRLARFARRHRGALTVAALAATAVAVLAWIGVHQIVEQRDTATHARDEATAAEAAAETARDDAQRRADQLLIMEARSLVDNNPTQAAAILKELSPASPRLGEARAVAQAAVVRGVAWSIATEEDLTAFTELSADGSALLQVGRDSFRVWDLDRRRQIISRRYPHGVRAIWAGGKVLVTSREQPAELVDPFAGPSGSATPLAIGPSSWAVSTATGDRIAFLDSHGEANLLDMASRQAQPLWPDHKANELIIAADGSWIAAADKAGMVVFDPTGHELTHRAGSRLVLFGSRFGDVAVIDDQTIALWQLHPAVAPARAARPLAPGWTEITTASPASPQLRPLTAAFVGHQLHICLSNTKIVVWTGQQLVEQLSPGGLSFGLLEADRDLLVVATSDSALSLVGPLGKLDLHLPAPLVGLRIAARAGAPRVVAIGRRTIVGFDLPGIIPSELPLSPGNMSFVDDDTLLVWGMIPTWRWYDVRTGKSVAFDYTPHGIPQIAEVDPTGGRVLIRETADQQSLVLLHKAGKTVERIANGPTVWGRLLPHGIVLFGGSDGRLLAAGDGQPPHEIAKLDGLADNAVGLGGTGFAALSATGELVRGNLATGSLDRRRLTIAPGTDAFVAADRTGRVLIAQGDRLSVWDSDRIIELAKLGQPILRIEQLPDDAALLELADHSLVRAQLQPGQPVRTVLGPSSQPYLVSGDGRLIARPSVNDQLTAVETTTMARWELPSLPGHHELVTMSPSTRRLVMTRFDRTALWTLPLAPPALRGWLDEQTNATTDDDHALTWRPANP